MAKCLAFQCIVYNCSDGVTYKMMEKFISGLAQCGAWCCLDEFNRINIEVLSVIASQVSEVRQALLAKVDKFTFQGVPDVDIKPNFGAFITMNPGYAGRTELPDNLKVIPLNHLGQGHLQERGRISDGVRLHCHSATLSE